MGVSEAAAHAADSKHTARENPVSRFAQSRLQTGEPEEWLQGGSRWRAAVQVAIEQGPRQIAGKRIVIGMRDAIDEQVWIELRQADHRQHLSGARINSDRRAVLVAEGLHCRRLQPGIDAQLQIGARQRRHALDHSQDPAFDVLLDVLVADLAAQAIFVPALQTGFSDMGQRRILAVAQRFQVIGVEPSDVANHVSEQLAIRITASQVGHDIDAGEAMPIDRQPRPLGFAQAQLQDHRPETPNGFPGRLELLEFFGAQADQGVDCRQGNFQVSGLLRHYLESIGRHVVGQQFAFAVKDQASRRDHRAWLDSIGFRTRSILFVLQYLQSEVTEAQAGHGQGDTDESNDGAPLELIRFCVRILHQVSAAHAHRASCARVRADAPDRAAQTTRATRSCQAPAPASSATARVAPRPTGGSVPPRPGH